MELKKGDFILIDKDAIVNEGYATAAKNIGAPIKIDDLTGDSICCLTVNLVFNVDSWYPGGGPPTHIR